MTEDEQKDIINKLRTDYKDYIVKPQKEGGGNNYYNEQILDLLPEEGKPANDILRNSIIMERINPPENDAYIIHNNELKFKKCVSELGIYGAILSDDKTIHMNKSFGFLLRTKESNVQEGGVVTGYSALDIPKLI